MNAASENPGASSVTFASVARCASNWFSAPCAAASTIQARGEFGYLSVSCFASASCASKLLVRKSLLTSSSMRSPSLAFAAPCSAPRSAELNSSVENVTLLRFTQA